MLRSCFRLVCLIFDNVAVGAVLALGAIALNLNVGFPLWAASLCLVGLAVTLYMINARLILFYIKKRAPDFYNEETWELTAGLGIVPKWVSKIGLLAYSPIIAVVIVWIWCWAT